MGFGFSQRSAVEAQVRHIVGEQVEKALDEGRADADFGKTVHGLRRRCKKLRGLLRLIEPRFDGFERENRALRDAANGLSGTRDAAVMVETFEAMLAFDRQRDTAPRLDMVLAGQVGQLLEGRVGRLPEAAERQQLLADYCDIIEAVGRRAASWSIGKRRFDCLGEGLERTYRQMREGMDAAGADSTAEALHEWRKQTKYHWHHVTLLRGAAPELLRGRIDLLDQLAELLGDHHNLHVLHENLIAQPGSIAPEAIATLGEVIGERQAVLELRAFALGRQLTAEKPATLRDRFEQYWQLLPDEA